MSSTSNTKVPDKRLLPGANGRPSLGRRIAVDYQKNYFKYLIVLPVLIWMALTPREITTRNAKKPTIAGL